MYDVVVEGKSRRQSILTSTDASFTAVGFPVSFVRSAKADRTGHRWAVCEDTNQSVNKIAKYELPTAESVDSFPVIKSHK